MNKLTVPLSLFCTLLIQTQAADNLANDQLVAWCIVPFDAKQRGPAARVKMLKRLGLKRVAYDWRAQHVKEFEEEFLLYKKHGLELFAFWSGHKEAFRLFEKLKLHPQIWHTSPSPRADSQKARVATAAKAMLPLVEQTRQLGCKLGLYNHGGWGGKPANLVAVCKYLRQHHDTKHVGIVYNFHHGHGDIANFEESLKLMQPYLLCLNLNGMNNNAHPKILPLGQGQHESAMLNTVRQSGYGGPIGILDHRNDTDTEAALRENLTGLKRILEQLDAREALGTRSK
jgi:sugar phosphate isomerase/epimerase